MNVSQIFLWSKTKFLKIHIWKYVRKIYNVSSMAGSLLKLNLIQRIFKQTTQDLPYKKMFNF